MTTIDTVAAPGLARALGLLATLTLLALLVIRQFAAMLPGEQTRRWARTLNVGIVPLLIAFAIIAVARLAAASPPGVGVSLAPPSPTLPVALPATATPDAPASPTATLRPPTPTTTPVAPAATAAPTAPTLPTAVPTARPSPPPPPSGSATGELLYASDKEGRWAIYSLRADGTGERRLTDLAANNYNGVWSPDGRAIAFVSERDGNQELYLMNADGSGQRRLTEAPGADEAPVWSPHGRSLVFISDRGGTGRAVYLMDREGGNVRRIVDAPAARPAWSSNWRSLAFVRPVDGGSAIFVAELDTLQIRNLTPPGARDDAPAYAPDGARLAFTSGPSRGDRQIVVANADGGGRRELTERGADDNNPVWSPDGAWLAFSSNRGGAFQIYIMRADGRDLRALTAGAGQKWHLSWKP